ncbi:MAG: helix-turn-helix transcriptional regulator [Planctomycetia bacterium]
MTSPPIAADGRTSHMVDPAGVAGLLSVSVKTVRRMIDAGKLPPPTRVGRLIRWRRADVLLWIDAGCPTPTRKKGGGR